jgi:DNA-binding NarL/FixJ family response regulator
VDASKNSPPITILLVDDHAVVRDGLRMILESAGDVKIVGEAENGHEAVRKAQELRPNVVLLDVAMPLLSGAETARQILHRLPGTKILVLTTYTDREVVRDLVAAGVNGYLTKDIASDQLLTAVREIGRGQSFFTPAIARLLLDDTREALSGGRQSPPPVYLTSREAEVLQLVAEGHPNKQIADILKISIKTVEKHRQSVMSKLNIHETASLTRYAVAKRIVQCEILPDTGSPAEQQPAQKRE